MDYAVLGRSMPVARDPLRSKSIALLVGCLLTVGVVVGGAVATVLRPDAEPGDASLVMSRQSGALFVRVDATLRPVANLASARLILGVPATPRIVDDDRLAGAESGPLLGIPGAPQRLGPPIVAADVRWTVCDNDDGTTSVAAGRTNDPPELARQSAVLVSAAQGEQTPYLLYEGRRAAVDPGDPLIARTLHLDRVKARRVSPTLLNTIPEAPMIASPQISEAGTPSTASGFPVGSVLRVAMAGTSEYYAVLRDGLQRIGRLSADLMRFADPHAGAEIVTVSPDVIAKGPLVDVLPVATFPDQTPAILDAGGSICATWAAGRMTINVGQPSKDSPSSVRLAGADDGGPAVDYVSVIPAGGALDVIAGPLTGNAGPGSRYLVAASGVSLRCA